MSKIITTGQYLKSLRRECGLTQEDAAEGIDVSLHTISNIENDRFGLDAQVLCKLLDLYNRHHIRLEDFYHRDAAMDYRIRGLHKRKPHLPLYTGRHGIAPNSLHYSVIDCLCEDFRCYGVAALERYDDVSVILKAFVDLGRSRSDVQAFVQQCNEGRLALHDLEYVVEKFLV